MPSSLTNRIAVAVVGVLLIFAACWFVVSRTNPSGHSGELPASCAKDTPRSAHRCDTNKAPAANHQVPVTQGDEFQAMLDSLVETVDSEKWSQARLLSQRIRLAVVADRAARLGRLVALIQTEASNGPSAPDPDWRVGNRSADENRRRRRVGFLMLATPVDAVLDLLNGLLDEWVKPLSGDRLGAWTRVTRLASDVMPREALGDESKSVQCTAFAFVAIEECRSEDSLGSVFLRDVLGAIIAKCDSHVVDPISSAVFDAVEMGKSQMTKADFHEILRLLAPLADNERLSRHLRHQIRRMLYELISDSLEAILAELGKIDNVSNALLLIERYLQADPNFLGIEKLLQTLLRQLRAGDAHWAMTQAFEGVPALKTRVGVTNFSLALSSADLGDSPGADSFRLACLAALTLPYKSNSADWHASLLDFGGSERTVEVIQQWIAKIPGVKTEEEFGLQMDRVGNLAKIICEAELSFSQKLNLLGELVDKVPSLDQRGQFRMLYAIGWRNTNELLEKRDAVLALWERVVTATFPKMTQKVFIRNQSESSGNVFTWSESLLRRLGYPRITLAAETALLERHAEAAALFSTGALNEQQKNEKARLEERFSAMVEAAYFK